MERRISRIALKYGIAFGSIILAFALRLLLEAVVQQQAAFLLFVPAVVVASAFGGAGSGGGAVFRFTLRAISTEELVNVD